MTNIYRHRYNITNVVLTAGKNIEIDPFRVGLFQIQYDYLGRRLPVIKISVSLLDSTFKAIKDNETNAKLSIEISETRLDEDDSLMNTKIFLKDTFDIVPTREHTTEFNTSQDEQKREEDPDRRNVVLYLIKNNHVAWMDKEIDTIFKNTDKAAALQSLFSMRGIPAKTCVITPPAINTPIDNAAMELGDLVGNVDWLNNKYGLFTSQIVLFDDYEYLYCIDRDNPNVILKKATDFDTVNFMVSNSTSDMMAATGSGDDSTNRCHYVNLAAVPEVNDTRNVSSKITFGTLGTIDSQGNVKKTTLDPNSTKVKFIQGQNELTASQYINTETNNMIQATFMVQDCALSIFKPYKIYRFTVEDPSSTIFEQLSNKVFRLRLCSMTLTRKHEYFEANTILVVSVTEEN